ncbi:MAG: helix-hairpin-helix domain-containing protein [Deltaproteobacteria bacterium]|nr:helix-hairpin-helix domain-containing protein [Deltaproteobacteria bacterium]
MINLEINDRTAGFMALLLALLLIYSLKLGLTRSKPPGISHNAYLFVQIGGDIKSPGVYAFDNRVNLLELIERAGGLNSNTSPPDKFSDCTFSSGARIVVKNVAHGCKFSQSEMSGFYKMTLGIPISLNKESEKGLTALPWIGTELAQAIVRERSKKGGFKHMNEIMDIRGIGPRLYKKIRPYVTL